MLGFDLYEFGLGVFSARGWLPAEDSPFRDSPFEDAFFAGGVNGRNPSFELPRLPAGVEGPRASFGDMAGS